MSKKPNNQKKENIVSSTKVEDVPNITDIENDEVIIEEEPLIEVAIETTGFDTSGENMDKPTSGSSYTLVAGRTRWLRQREFDDYAKKCSDRDVAWSMVINPEDESGMSIILGHYNTIEEAYRERKIFVATKGIICSVI